MKLQNQIKQTLKAVRDLGQWLITNLESLDLKSRVARTYGRTVIILSQIYTWTVKTAKLSEKLTIQACRKTRTVILLSIDFAARKKFLFEQWSIKYIKPRWNKFTEETRRVLALTTEALVHISKTVSLYLWQLTCDCTKYTFRQLRALSITTFKASRNFLIQTGIFLAYCGKKSLHYTKLFYSALIKACRFSWRIFKRLLTLLYKYSKAVAILSGKGIRQATIFLVFCLHKLWHFSKYIFALSLKYSFIAARQFDRGFKHAGVLLTLGLCKFWQVLILFGQGLLIIASYLWRLFIRSIIGIFKFTLVTLKAIDNGFKKTGFILTFSLIKTWQFLALFIRLLATAIDSTIETILAFTVQSIRTTGVFLWRSLKYILWFPVILLNAVLPQAAINHLKQYARLIRLDKPIGILLLLWPTLIALWIAAKGWPDINVLLVFVAGVFLMRSAGCAINDYADRDIDPKVKRTKDRPLASGAITVIEALVIFVSLCVMAFMLVLLMNGLTITMSFIGLALAATYPFMKRYHYLPQVHLGAAFGWAVPMAFAAQANELAPVAWLLFFATVLWATAYDTMYAMVDREDDILIGAKSTAILFEDADTLIIGIIQGILIICLIMIGLKAELGGLYFLSVLIATGFAAWQQFLIKDRQPSQCFKAFMNNNWFGLILFIGVFLEYQVGGISS
jgi:4-hydroxybenzoate polyprenyltransferase